MRRTLLLLLLLVSLGAGAYVYINEQMAFWEPPAVPPKKETLTKAAKPESPKTEEIALTPVPSLFPSGLMVWIHSTGSGEIIKQIKKSNFFKQAVEYEIIDPSKPLLINIETTSNKKNILSKISSQLEEKFLMDILGQEVGLAFYPPDKAGISNYLFAAKISTITKIQEKLNRLKDSVFGGAATVSEKKYNNKTIVIYQSKEQKNSFQYVIFENIFLGSSSDILLKKGIDLIEGKENSRFVDSAEFKSLFKASDLAAAGLFFMDIEKIIPHISKYIVPSQKVSSTAIEDAKKELESFKNLGFTFTIRKGLKIKSWLTINTKKADQKLIETVGLEPRESKSLSFISDKVIVYGANIYNPTYFFNEFTKAFETGKIKKNAGEKTLEEFLKESIGINLADIIPFIGNEFFYSAFAPGKALPLPIPDITIGFEIKNKKKIELLLKKFETNMMKSLQQKSFQRDIYKDYNIYYLPTPIGIEPGYSIVNNFLLLSINQTGIKRLIDTLKKETLQLNKNQKFISAKIPEKNNGLFFINATLLWDNLSEVITKMPANFLPTSPAQSLESRIKFLDLVRAVQSISGYFIYEKNKINASAFIAVKDIPKIRTKKELLAFLEKTKQKALSSAGSLSGPSTALVSYDYTYDPAGKRDPFQSLVTGRQIRKEKLVKFLEDIESIEPVNLYLYNKIKKKDPVLYKKLRNYASLFKSKKTMEKLSQEERAQKLGVYKQLLDIARTGFHDPILGPLQNEKYSSLKLIGIIWGKLGTIALIETPDGKGHTVEVNDMIGPNYGVVKKIEKNKIIVVERYINYIEEISKKRQEIKLPESEESI